MDDPASTPLGPLPFEAPPALFDALAQAYAEPRRWYHTLDHAREVLAEVGRCSWAQPREVALAALFHDAVYVAGRTDNESRSADLADACIRRWLSPLAIDVARVRDLIELTARHGQVERDELDDDQARFLDCDTAILGAPPEVYDRYEEGVRREYAAIVPPEAWRAGRAAFLASMSRRPRIFHTDELAARFEAPARANLARALAALTS